MQAASGEGPWPWARQHSSEEVAGEGQRGLSASSTRSWVGLEGHHCVCHWSLVSAPALRLQAWGDGERTSVIWRAQCGCQELVTGGAY